jgi:Niemann-Pick C1 protein
MDIKINSPCCQRFGFCGEQFDKDIIFNDDGTIKTSRLRFQHRTGNLKLKIEKKIFN